MLCADGHTGMSTEVPVRRDLISADASTSSMITVLLENSGIGPCQVRTIFGLTQQAKTGWPAIGVHITGTLAYKPCLHPERKRD